MAARSQMPKKPQKKGAASPATPSASSPVPSVLLLSPPAEGKKLRGALEKQGWTTQLALTRPEALEILSRGAANLLAVREEGSLQSNLGFLRGVESAAPGIGKILLAHGPEPKRLMAYTNKGGVEYLLSGRVTPGQLVQAVQQLWQKRLDFQAGLQNKSAGKGGKGSLPAEPQGRKTPPETSMKHRNQGLSKTNRELRKALKEIEHKNKTLTVLNQSLKIQSSTDPLTGLYNRREFLNRIRMEWGRYRRYNRPLSLIMLDIDHFKAVNDTHGHECGDQVLQALGLLIRRNKRAQDLCCRYGGEEFVVLLTETSLESAFHVAEGLRLLVADHEFRYKTHLLSVFVSAGVSGALEQQPKDVEAFINLADTALYKAKGQGRNRTVIIDPEDKQSILRQSVSRTPSKRRPSATAG